MAESPNFMIDLKRSISGLNRAVELDDEYSVDIKRLIDKLADSASFAEIFHRALRENKKTSSKYQEDIDKLENFEDVDLSKDLMLINTSRDFSGTWKFVDLANDIEVPNIGLNIARQICNDVNVAYAIGYTRLTKKQ